MLFSPFIAARYLKPKRLYLSIITTISVIGVSLAVWLLTVVIAVFTGYGERIRDSILGFEPHLVINSGGIIDDYEQPVLTLLEQPGVKSVTPFVTGQVIMEVTNSRGTYRKAPMIRGIMPPEGEELERMRKKLKQVRDPEHPDDEEKFVQVGDFDINGFYTAVIGDGLAAGMGIELGDKILLFSPTDVDTLMNAVSRAEEAKSDDEKKKWLDDIRERTAPQELTITGIFDSGHFDFDGNVVFTHLETAQVLYNFDLEECHGIAIRTDDGFKANQYKEELYKVLTDQYRILTWGQIHQALFDAVAGERQMMYLILFMVAIVASFCTMNTMITVTFQKRAEIGLMKALGAREEQVASVFLFQGIIVGLLGVALGLLIGWLTVQYRNEMAGWLGEQFGINFFSEEVYKVDGGLPAVIQMKDVLIISIGSFLLCVVAALIPATVAASMQPAKALRSE